MLKQYNADWDVHTSATTLPAHVPPHPPPPPRQPSVLYKGVPFRSAVTLHKKQFDTFWFQHKYIHVGDNCGLKVAPYSAQSTTTLMLKKKKSLNTEIKKATLQGKKKEVKTKKKVQYLSLC